MYEEEKDNYVAANLDLNPSPDSEYSSLLYPNSVAAPKKALYVAVERSIAKLPIWVAKKTGGLTRKLITHEVARGEDVYRFKAEIIGAKGLPTTFDLQVFHALEELLAREMDRKGRLSMPFTVRALDLVQASDRVRSGRLYKDVAGCIDRLIGLVIYTYVEDGKEGRDAKGPALHLLSAVNRPGRHDPKAVQPATWQLMFEPWYLRNLEAGYCLLLNHNGFKQLTRPIAMLLHHLLTEAFVRGQGQAVRSYADIAASYLLPRYTAQSRIRQQLDPSHEELVKIGFLKSWYYRPGVRRGEIEIVWEAGIEWWKMAEEMKGYGLLDESRDGLNIFVPADAVNGHGQVAIDDQTRIAAVAEELIAFEGGKRDYLNFYRKAARLLDHSVIYHVVGSMRERLVSGWRPTKGIGRYLVSELKRAARVRGILWDAQPGTVLSGSNSGDGRISYKKKEW